MSYKYVSSLVFYTPRRKFLSAPISLFVPGFSSFGALKPIFMKLQVLENTHWVWGRNKRQLFSRGREQAGGLKMHLSTWTWRLKSWILPEVVGILQVHHGLAGQWRGEDQEIQSWYSYEQQEWEFHQHPVVRKVLMRGLQQEQGEDQLRGRPARSQGQWEHSTRPYFLLYFDTFHFHFLSFCLFSAFKSLLAWQRAKWDPKLLPQPPPNYFTKKLVSSLSQY